MTARYPALLLTVTLVLLLSSPGAGEQGEVATIYNRPHEAVLVTAGTPEKDKSRLVEDPDARSGWALKADPADKPGKGYMWYEYTYTQGPGKLRGKFRLKVADNTNPDPVALIRGNIANSEIKEFGRKHSEIPVRGTDFAAAGKYQEFSVEITKGEKGFGDWGLQTTGAATFWFDGLTVEQVSRFTIDELLPLIDRPVKPASLALASGGFRVHETYGLFMPHWKVKEAIDVVAARHSGAQRTQSHLIVHSQNTRLTGFPDKWEELYKHSVVVLNNVPAKSVSIVGTIMLKQYVEDGGCLIMMGDTHGLVPGKWMQSVLGPLLPVEPGESKDLVRSPEPLPLQVKAEMKDLDWTKRPYTLYYHSAEVRPKARVLIYSGKIPLVVECKVGKGRIIVLLASVCGEKDPKAGGVPFWQWNDWPALMAKLISRASL